MIAVTEPAKELIRNLDRPPEGVLRLEPTEESGLAFVVGDAMEGDQVVEASGQELLHINGMVSQALDGAVLDAVETPEGMGLTLAPPGSSDGAGPGA